MIERGMIERTHRGPDRSRLGLGRSIHQRADPGVHDRADTHYAGLDGHVQRRPRETVVADFASRNPQRRDLRVRRRIGASDR